MRIDRSIFDSFLSDNPTAKIFAVLYVIEIVSISPFDYEADVTSR